METQEKNRYGESGLLVTMEEGLDLGGRQQIWGIRTNGDHERMT